MSTSQISCYYRSVMATVVAVAGAELGVNLMRKVTILLIAMLLLKAPVVRAQVFGGVYAPDAVTMRITQVTATGMPETVTESTFDSPVEPVTIAKKIKTRSAGYDVVGETETTRYKISCIVSYREEETTFLGSEFPGESHTDRFVDGKEDSWESVVPLTDSSVANHPTQHHGTIMPAIPSFGTRAMVQQYDDTTDIVNSGCEQFHVGMTVVFYSLDRLIWLTETDAKRTYVHGKAWEATGWRDGKPISDTTYEPSPGYHFTNFWLRGDNGYFHEMEKPYTLESEEAKSTPGNVKATPNRPSSKQTTIDRETCVKIAAQPDPFAQFGGISNDNAICREAYPDLYPQPKPTDGPKTK